MKTKIKNYITVIAGIMIVSIIFFSCSTISQIFAPESWRSSQQAYERGDIQTSVHYAAVTLRNNPGYEETIDFLLDILPHTYEQYYTRAQRAESIDNWDQAFLIYSEIQELSDIINSIPPQTHPKTEERVSFPTNDVQSEIENARENAAEMHYQKALALEEKESYREAARSYTQSLEYFPNYKDSIERYNLMREAALRRVAIMNFENLSGERRFGPIGERFSQYTVSELMSNPNNMEFMEIISRDRLDQLLSEQDLGRSAIIDESSAAETGKILGIAAFVFGNVTSISTQRLPDRRQQTREEATFRQRNTDETYTLTALVTIITRRASATVSSNYQIVDVASGRILDAGSKTSRENVEIQFCHFTGEERAISKETMSLCRDEEGYPPPPNELVDRALQNASRDLSGLIARHFN